MTKNRQNVNKSVFRFIPYLDYTKSINDNDLYNHLNLTNEEITYINNKTL
jgi:hypothetical protein